MRFPACGLQLSAALSPADLAEAMKVTPFTPENIPFTIQLPGDDAGKADIFSMGTLLFALLVRCLHYLKYAFLLLHCSLVRALPSCLQTGDPMFRCGHVGHAKDTPAVMQKASNSQDRWVSCMSQCFRPAPRGQSG